MDHDVLREVDSGSPDSTSACSPDSSFDLTTGNLEMPCEILEESISDPSPCDVDLAPLEQQFEVLDKGSERGKPLLVSSLGFSYTIQRTRGATRYWWCSVRPNNNRCPAVMIEKDGAFRPGAMDHNHEPTAGLKTKRRIYMKLREEAKLGNFTQSSCHIAEEIFRQETRQATTHALKDLCTYMDNTWMCNATWHVRKWSVLGTNIRTNNDVEAWHKRLNGKAARKNLPLYTLIPLLKKEADFILLQIRLMTDGQLDRRQTTRQRQKAELYFQLWDNYQSGEMSCSQFLKEISKVNGPMVN